MRLANRGALSFAEAPGAAQGVPGSPSQRELGRPRARSNAMTRLAGSVPLPILVMLCCSIIGLVVLMGRPGGLLGRASSASTLTSTHQQQQAVQGQQAFGRLQHLAKAGVSYAGGCSTLSPEAEAAFRSRAKAAVLGALVADAATMGLHWIYNKGKIQELLKSGSETRIGQSEFFEPPSCPYYQYEPGSFSPYGDELLPVLQYLANHGSIEGQAFAEYLAEYYRAYPGRLNKTAKHMMQALLQEDRWWPDCGDTADTQANSFVKVIPIVALYGGCPDGRLELAVDAAVRAQQNNDAAVAYALAAARVLEQVLLGTRSLDGAVTWAATAADASLPTGMGAVLLDVLRNRQANLADLLYAPGSDTAAGRWGPSCATPGAFQGALLAALQATNGSYVAGVRSNIVLGGDNCSRAVLIGALLAGQAGSLPFEWQAKTRRADEVSQLVDVLLQHRTDGSGSYVATH